MILGVSQETESVLESYVAEKGAKYPIVRATNGGAKYGISGYPTYYVLSPDGEVLEPDGRVPSDAWLEKALKEVVLVPKLPGDSRFDPLRKAWEKSDYQKIDEYLTKMLSAEDLDQELRAVFEKQRADFDAMVARTETRVGSLAQGPDYWRAEQKLEQLAKAFDGLPLEERIEAVLDRFEEDEAIKKEISASRMLEKITSRFDPSKVSQRRKLVEALEQFEQRYAGMHAAKVAAATRAQLTHSH